MSGRSAATVPHVTTFHEHATAAEGRMGATLNTEFAVTHRAGTREERRDASGLHTTVATGCRGGCELGPSPGHDDRHDVLASLQAAAAELVAADPEVSLLLTDERQAVEVAVDGGPRQVRSTAWGRASAYLVAPDGWPRAKRSLRWSGSQGPPGMDEVAALLDEVRSHRDEPMTVEFDDEAPVVLGPAAAATLIHECVGHALEADTFRAMGEDIRPALGGALAAAELSVALDPAVGADTWTAASFDDEGAAARTVTLVDGGAPVATLGGKRSADGARFRASFSDAIQPRCRWLSVAPGGSGDAAGAAASLRRANYVTTLREGAFSPRSGRVALDIRTAHLVEAGEVVGRQAAARVVGDLRALLERLQVVCDDRELQRDLCAKRGQRVTCVTASPGLGVLAGALRRAR